VAAAVKVAVDPTDTDTDMGCVVMTGGGVEDTKTETSSRLNTPAPLTLTARGLAPAALENVVVYCVQPVVAVESVTVKRAPKDTVAVKGG